MVAVRARPACRKKGAGVAAAVSHLPATRFIIIIMNVITISIITLHCFVMHIYIYIDRYRDVCVYIHVHMCVYT